MLYLVSSFIFIFIFVLILMISKQPNPYRILKCCKGKYFSIMHDGIQKFSKELLQVYTQIATTKSKSIEIVINVPWCLHQVNGVSLKTQKLVEQHQQNQISSN